VPVRFAALIDQLALDLRHSVRVLKNAPAFTAVAILSLALGIGANTAIFSVVNAVMLKLLPVSDPARLVSLFIDTSARGRPPSPASYYTNPIWEHIRDHQDVFDGVTAYSQQTFDVGAGGEARHISGLFVSGRFFDVLGVRPWIGRTFTSDDDRRGGGPDGPVAVLSYAYWRQHYNASSNAIGATLRLADQPFTIVGVAPPEFFGLEVGKIFDAAVPLGTEPLLRGRENSSLDARTSWWLLIAGRMKTGQSLEQAMTGLRTMQAAIREATLPPRQQLSEHFIDPLGVSPASTGVSWLRSDYRPALLILMTIVGVVLLIACANLANLLLARATVRQREFAVRLAVGASRGRLVRQMLTESLLLATAGAALGLAFAQSASRLIVRSLSSSRSPVFVDVSIDWHVLAFTMGVAIATVALFGLAPAFQSTSVSANEALKSGARGIATGWKRFNLEKLLVTTQIALSLVLVFGASLFVRSFTALATRDPGFDASHLMQVATNIVRAGYRQEQRLLVYEQLQAALRGIPGVQSVASAQITPVRGDMWNNRVQVDGFTPTDQRDSLLLSNRVSPGYFQTLGTPFHAGRDFNEHDTVAAPQVAIVNEATVRKFFHGESPIGRVIRQEVVRDTWQLLTVVGVVRDTAYQSLRETPPPLLYFPMGQQEKPGNFITFLLRTKGDTTSLAPAVTHAGAAINKNITFELRTLDTQLNDSLIQERLLALLSGFFGLLALLVAGIGLYGMMSLAVTRRRNEIGVRMALGADPRGIVRLVLWDVTVITVAGLIAGTAVALPSSRLVSTLLFGLTPTDPATGVLAIALLAGVAMFAGYLPARRAARLDPMAALREE
jgi:putative ABC transport system permease protein